VRERLPGDHQPFLGADAFALDPRLHPAPDHLDLYRPFLPVSHCQVRPRLRSEALTPLRHRLPRRLGPPSTPWVRGQRRLEVAHRGGARHPQDRTLTPLAELLTKPREATELIIPGHPAVWDLLPPQIEHLQALFVAGMILHLWRHVAFLASWLVVCPLLGQGQAEVE